MGFFSNSDPGLTPPAEELAPVSYDRLKSVLESHEWNYSQQEDGALVANWDHAHHFFLIFGESDEMCAIRGIWSKKLTNPERFSELLLHINEWNKTKLFPKAYLLDDDEPSATVGFECVIDYEFGVTEKQLDLLVRQTLVTGHQLCEQLDGVFPDAVSQIEEPKEQS